MNLRELTRLEELGAATALFDRTWSSEQQQIVPLNLFRALTHAGNYVVGAYAGDRMVGAALGVFGMHADALHLHSHVVAVDADIRHHGVGRAIKLHQRAWALARGIRTVQWTYDPLVRRNAYLNLCKLGARITSYYEDFYGEMPDAINQSDESDRVLVEWNVTDPTLLDASPDRVADPTSLLAEGATVLLDEDEGQRPLQAAQGSFAVPSNRSVVLCRVPEDIVAIRRQDPDRALQWRRALRATLGRSLEEGYEVTGFARSGWYVLRHPGTEA